MRKISVQTLFVLLIVHIFFGFIWTQTRVSVPYMNNIIALLFAILWGILLFKHAQIYVNLGVMIWIPFLLYTMFGYLIQGEIVYFCLWTICLFIMFLGSSTTYNIYSHAPFGTIFYIGLFLCIGVYFELIFHDFYDTYIAPFYLTADRIISMGRGNYGFAGFSYQLDTTAVPILYAIGIILYCYEGLKKDKYLLLKRILLYLIFTMAVILTGKRMNALLAVIVPGLIFVFSDKNSTKRIRNCMGMGIASLIGIYFLFTNAEILYNSSLFHRVGSTIIGIQKGIDITAGRTDLYEKALDLYRNNRIFGVGVGNFMNYTHADTDVHNVYLQVLCEQGIIGEVLLILPLAINIIYTFKLLHCADNEKDDGIYKFSLFVQFVYIFYSITGNLNVNMYGYMIYFIILAITYSNNNKYNSIKPMI